MSMRMWDAFAQHLRSVISLQRTTDVVKEDLTRSTDQKNPRSMDQLLVRGVGFDEDFYLVLDLFSHYKVAEM